ncbi:DUF4142 domain-containing protein [Legionella sp.]|uniref:DUF4142 domain-containing protein n=1 Tax=Legionella sp. TaxID=459 RepID=UPI003CA1DBEC
MKSKKILSLIISICIGTSIFATNSYAATEPNTNSLKNRKAQTQKDGEIIAILITVDKNEIALAKLALKKNTTPQIKNYAQMLKTQHTQNLNEALKLSKKIGLAPVDSSTVSFLQKEGVKGLATLSTLKSKDFDKAYINAMVSGHTAVLKMIDDNLLKNVSNSSLKEFVIATRPHIKFHLQQGQIIQKELH